MKIKVKTCKATIELILLLLTFVLITKVLTQGSEGILGAAAIYFGVILFLVYKSGSKSEASIVLALSILLSAFQNVYLGYYAPYLTPDLVKIMTILNYLCACVVFVILFIRYSKEIIKDKIFILFVLMLVYCLFSLMLWKSYIYTSTVSVASSVRNITAVFIFFLIGVMASKHLDMRQFQTMILIISAGVILFCALDWIMRGQLWRSLNITELWLKKGIRVQPSGLPTNFYSSEKINGERIRRVASSFADPVNLGAFLYMGLCVSWFRKKKTLFCLLGICIALTVSKGALLGILIFACVYTYYYRSKSAFYLTLGATGFAGLLFLGYAMLTSANSVFFHIAGLMAAFSGLLRNPLGTGIGSSGVLARQFSEYTANIGISETGLGMIIGQLGIVGLAVYICFFIIILRSAAKIENKREAVLCISLITSIIANIFFNEVGLSPNSCAAYFMIVGVYVSRAREPEEKGQRKRSLITDYQEG